jgi:hypothetical protein
MNPIRFALSAFVLLICFAGTKVVFSYQVPIDLSEHIVDDFYLGNWVGDDNVEFLAIPNRGWEKLDCNLDGRVDKSDIEVLHAAIVANEAVDATNIHLDLNEDGVINVEGDVNAFYYWVSGYTSFVLDGQQQIIVDGEVFPDVPGGGPGPQPIPVFSICIILGDGDWDGTRDPDYDPILHPLFEPFLVDPFSDNTISDMTALLQNLWTTEASLCQGDINFDGVVDVSDYNVLREMDLHESSESFPAEGLPAYVHPKEMDVPGIATGSAIFGIGG